MTIEFCAVDKSYGHRVVLRNVTASVAGRAAITGANGTGKSTLLGMAATILRPTDGTITIAGHDTRSAATSARQALGFAPQMPSLYPDLTPLEHIGWWRRLHHVGSTPDDCLANLAAAGLRLVADRPTRQLSAGQRQRLSLCLAMAHNPEVLLLDEPFTWLDANGVAWLQDALAARTGTTLMAVQDYASVAGLCERHLHLGATGLEEK